MSGPIVRKYGFPNFEQIFGKKEVPHGSPPEVAPENGGEAARGAPSGPSQGSASGGAVAGSEGVAPGTSGKPGPASG